MMKAEALITHEGKRFAIESVEVPEPGPDQIAVRTHYSGVSIGTEFALIRSKISWGPFPICTGYMGTGVVEGVGAEISNFKVGDSVYFRGGEGITLDGKPVSSATGAHCSLVVLDPNTTHGAAHVPSGVDMETASMFVMPAVGLYGVDMANPRMGQTVVVYGCGLIGLGVVASCVHRGCRVIAIDLDERRLEIARSFGADHTIDGSKIEIGEAMAELAPDGADVVFESTGIPTLLDTAIKLCKTYGTFVWQGNYGADPVSLQFLVPHGKRLTMYFPCDDGLEPCRTAVIRNIGLGALKWDECITHHIDYKEAPAIYDRIEKGDNSILGVTVRWK
jgi:2-desacetyl-2-hydroxyethyl bacteriochlorophyllide A dehydrogenase